ncbi:MAG: NYN domain-containing protein [Pirellulales bacterium]|nr:NYN domain-containing protein [Pirellulales bacterium]
MEHRLALLVDGENVAGRHAAELRRRTDELGSVRVCRVIGNWQGNRGLQWKAAARRWPAIEFVQRTGRAKNAADVALAIQAVDLLRDGGLDGFCLASADADFVPLAQRIHRAGLLLYGFAAGNCSRALQTQCDACFSLGECVPAAAEGSLVELIEQAILARSGDDGWANLPSVGNYLRSCTENDAVTHWGFSSLSQCLRKLGQFELQDVGTLRRVRVAA